MPAKTKILSGIAGTLFLMVLSIHGETLGIPSAFAQDKVVTDTQGGIMGGLLFAVGTLNFLAFFCLKLLSYLVDPDTIFGVSGNVNMMLRLWQISRDIMNILFAIMLLAGAILTIVFGKQEVVKQHLVKFILAVILVNFSWFFPRVIFDIANVTTATIYGLPNLVNSECQWIDKDGNPQNCVVVTDILFFEDATTGTCPEPAEPPLEMMPIMKVCLAALVSPGANTGFGILNGIVVNHGRLNYLGVIAGSPPAGGTGGTIAETLRFVIILVMVTFMHLMLVFPLIAMTAVMIIRIPILWLTVSFMPFMFIGFVIGDKFIKVNSMEIFTKHFITAAFLPAIIAMPLSIGYIMLNEVARLSPTIAPPAGLAGKVSFFPQAQNWWQVIWILLAFMIMWVGSRWAMKRDEIYSRFTEPIFNVGNSFLKLPVTTPFIPHDTTGDGKPDRKSSALDISRNLQNLGVPFGHQSSSIGAPAAAATAGPGASDTDVVSALKNINTGTGDTAGAIRLMDKHLQSKNVNARDHSAVKTFLQEYKGSNTASSDVKAFDVDSLAQKIANAPRTNP